MQSSPNQAAKAAENSAVAGTKLKDEDDVDPSVGFVDHWNTIASAPCLWPLAFCYA